MRTPKTNRSFWFVLVLGCLTFYPVAGRSQTSTATADFFNHGVPASQGSSKLAQPSHGSQLEASTQVSSPSAITIDETTKSIRVDGYLVDWPVTRMILLNQKSQVTYGILNWKSKDDFSGRVFMTYDSQYLYLSAIVQKSSSVVNDNGGLSLWDGDCVELFLSTNPPENHSSRISKNDYHIGFSPGSGCNNPQMFCFNKEKRIGGGRIMARSTGHGYILEACVPLTFFEGLQIKSGNTAKFNLALDAGGSSSGNRTLQLDLTGNPQSWQNPSLWGTLQWIGKTEVSIPQNDQDNLYASLVLDGTKGQTFWGRRTLVGSVLDEKGKPISGALVTTWPKTKTVMTDKDGRFVLDKVKVYESTVVYARRDGYGTSLTSIDRKDEPVAVRLKLLPDFLTSDDSVSGAFYGQSFQVPVGGDLLKLMSPMLDWLKPMGLNILKLVGTDQLSSDREAQYAALDYFVQYARGLGAEPMIELPVNQDDSSVAADWVRHCNVDKKEKVLYWTIGDEPDLYADKRSATEFADYNVYHYINDFRSIYNAVKEIDPSVLIMGPELAWRYTSAEDDWLTPFIQFDGDIVNMASVHHYGSIKASQCNTGSVLDDVRHMQTLTRGLKSRIAINADVYIPLVITGGNVCIESTDNTLTAKISMTPTPIVTVVSAKSVKPTATPKVAEDSGPNSFWAAVWVAEQAGTLMKDHMPIALFSYLGGNGALDFFNATGAKPDYWALRLISDSMRGKVIWAQVQNSNAVVYATQDIKTKDVSLLIINKGSNYYHPKVLLNAKEAEISVDAGLNQTFDYEIPYYSIVVLKIKADKSHDEAVLYTKKMAQAGKPPEVTVITPW